MQLQTAKCSRYEPQRENAIENAENGGRHFIVALTYYAIGVLGYLLAIFPHGDDK